MAGFEKTVKTSRAGRFPPPRRGPRRRSRLGLLTALDAARRPSPPRPQRGPRRRRRPSPPSVPRPTPVAFVSPETDARASTTWRLQPPSVSLVLWRKPRNPPSVVTCALDPGVDVTAAAWSELLHGSSPSTLDARVPATKDQAHDHTAQLTIHLSQAGVSTPHSSISPLMSALSTHHKRTKNELREKQKPRKTKKMKNLNK